ncbi:MAG: integration host factor subunit beta [Thioalkalivibrionaceae bacterium]
MTKSELIERLVRQLDPLPLRDVTAGVKILLDTMSNALSQGDRVEIRGFGTFSLHRRAAREGRNPRTGESVRLPEKYIPHFKPGKALRERANDGGQREETP